MPLPARNDRAYRTFAHKIFKKTDNYAPPRIKVSLPAPQVKRNAPHTVRFPAKTTTYTCFYFYYFLLIVTIYLKLQNNVTVFPSEKHRRAARIGIRY